MNFNLLSLEKKFQHDAEYMLYFDARNVLAKDLLAKDQRRGMYIMQLVSALSLSLSLVEEGCQQVHLRESDMQIRDEYPSSSRIDQSCASRSGIRRRDRRPDWIHLIEFSASFSDGSNGTFR